VNIVIDYGNSSAKVGIFDQQKLHEKYVFDTPQALKNFLEKDHSENVIVCSVALDATTVSSWALHVKKKFVLNPALPLPIKNHYATPASLGVDRLSAVCGAKDIFPEKNCLVVDVGTCIKYDFIDAQNNYLGGGISPGLSMRFKALNTFTVKLPLVQPVDHSPLIGDSTESCIQSGVINGVLQEINGTIEEYQKKFDDLKVILCGGDTLFFENKLKGGIFAVPELVLRGLNSILIYNISA
jgi:type III pantothenate kinase